MRRAPFLAALAAALAGCGAGADPGPSVVLVTCDTLRADRLGLYGCPRGTSPNLDTLARTALVFDAAWSTAPLTGPALSALMTGRPPEELGLADNRNVLAEGAETLAERLAEGGVETAAVVSNWVLRRRSELPAAGVQQGFAHFDDRMTAPEASRPALSERVAPDTTDAALAWLDGRADAERPFFLWVHYQDPHGPYTAPSELRSPLAPEENAAELAVGENERGFGALPRYQVVDGERRPSVYRARYEAEIRYFDRELGRLVAGLERRGVLARALLLFTADHGESLGEHGYYFSHGQHLHQELVRVPLLVRPPGGASAPGRRAEPVSHLDLFPTVLAAFGLDPAPTRGLDLLGAELPPERVLPQYLRGGWSASGARYRLVVEHGARRLFDLETDPREETDLAPTSPEILETLAEGHRAFLRRVPPAPLEPARASLDPAAEKGLEALGYGGDDEGDEPEERDEGGGAPERAE